MKKWRPLRAPFSLAKVIAALSTPFHKFDPILTASEQASAIRRLSEARCYCNLIARKGSFCSVQFCDPRNDGGQRCERDPAGVAFNLEQANSATGVQRATYPERGLVSPERSGSAGFSNSCGWVDSFCRAA